jgi:hypothetical protein
LLHDKWWLENWLERGRMHDCAANPAQVPRNAALHKNHFDIERRRSSVHKTKTKRENSVFAIIIIIIIIYNNNNDIMPSSSPLPSHITPKSSTTSSQPPAASSLLYRLLQSVGQHKKALAIVLVLLILVLVGVIFGWLGAVVFIVLLLGMVLGALIARRYAVHTDVPTRRRSSVSTPAKQALAPQQQQKNKRGDIEESVIDVYTTTEIDDEDDDDDSATASRFQDPHDEIHPQQHHRQPHHLPEESYLSEFSVSQAGHDEPRQRYSSRDFTYGGGDNASHDFTTYGGDETSFAGYSISAAIDTGASVLQPPSFRHHFGRNNKNDRQRRMSDSVMASSFVRQSSAKTLPVVVQRIVKAPPGRLGITIHVTKEGPQVQSVRTSSPLDGLLFPGDIIVAINTTDVRTMKLDAVHKIMEETNGMQRIIKVLTMDDITRTQLPKKEEESA